MRVRLSPSARDYVLSEAAYLKERSPPAAQHFGDGLKRLKHNLARFPQMGQTTEEMPVPNVLRFVMGAYLIDYQINSTEIIILAIRHGQQRPPGTPLDDDRDYEIDSGADPDE